MMVVNLAHEWVHALFLFTANMYLVSQIAYLIRGKIVVKRYFSQYIKRKNDIKQSKIIVICYKLSP